MHGNGKGSLNGGLVPWWHFGNRRREVDLSGYQHLSLQLHNALPRGESGLRSVLFVTPKETKLCAAGSLLLATSMAQELQRPILLVDATVNSDVSRTLKAPPSAGVTDFLKNPVQPLQELVSRTSRENVWFMPHGTDTGPTIQPSPENARDLLQRTSRHWDFVVVAGGPVLSNPVTLAMAPHVGRVLLLVRANRTYLADIEAARNVLESCQARDVSLVMTDTDRPRR